MIFLSILTALKTHIKPIGAFLLGCLIFGIGFYFGRTTVKPEVKEVRVEVPVVKTETVTQTQTVIKYVQKPSPHIPWSRSPVRLSPQRRGFERRTLKSRYLASAFRRWLSRSMNPASG